jgi:hypothetical protein
VPANFQRLLPFFLILILALFVLPALFRKHKSGPSAATRATQTIEAMKLIDRGEQAYKSAHDRFTPHLADLLPLETKLARDLSIGLDVRLDVSTDGSGYLAQVTSDVLRLVRARGATKVIARSCLVLKSGSGVSCPPQP